MSTQRFVYPKPEDWERKARQTWISPPSGLTLGEIIEWAEEHDVARDSFLSGGIHFKQVRMETDDEWAMRVGRMEESERKHREFIARRYAEIHAEVTS